MRERKETCKVLSTEHLKFCLQVNPEDPAYHPRMSKIVQALSLGVPIESLESREGGGMLRTKTNYVPHLPSPSAVLANIRAVKACPHWSNPACGCAQGKCALGKGRDGLVTYEECLRCLGRK